MSTTYGNSDCADKTNSVKNGSRCTVDIVETEENLVATVVMAVPIAENDGKCKCGSNCACTNCRCGGHQAEKYGKIKEYNEVHVHGAE